MELNRGPKQGYLHLGGEGRVRRIRNKERLREEENNDSRGTAAFPDFLFPTPHLTATRPVNLRPHSEQNENYLSSRCASLIISNFFSVFFSGRPLSRGPFNYTPDCLEASCERASAVFRFRRRVTNCSRARPPTQSLAHTPIFPPKELIRIEPVCEGS